MEMVDVSGRRVDKGAGSGELQSEKKVGRRDGFTLAVT